MQTKFIQVATAAILLGAFYGVKSLGTKPTEQEIALRAAKNAKNRGKGNVDKEFWERVIKIIKHILPGWNCTESRYAVLLLALLVVRTLMSIWLADVNGRVVKAIVNKNLKQFVYRVSKTDSYADVSTDICTFLVCFAIFYCQLSY